ncbi:MAG TPA: anti-sigma factor [Gaiellaceae bacterium]|nr:anti-sigma factor [Gaiellaceae bacterium]
MADAIHDLTPAYALDALDEAERLEYEVHLASCDDCRGELESFWSVTAALAHAAAGPPPPSELRGRILDAARNEGTNVVLLRRRWVTPVAAASAAVAAVAAIGVGIWASSVAQELDRTRAAAVTQEQAVEVLADPLARNVPLQGVNGRIVVTPTGRAALVLNELEPAPAGKTYEIWVVADGTPKPAGLFEGASARTVVPVTRPVPEGALIAVTLENDGGVTVPQGPRIFASPTA